MSHTDPTGTTSLRKKFSQEMGARFDWLKSRIVKKLTDEQFLDLAFAFQKREGFQFSAGSAEKIEAFMDWLREQESRGILRSVEGPGKKSMSDRWTDTYIESGYKKGMLDAYTKGGYKGATGLSGKDWLSAGFLTADHADRIGVLYTRAYNQLKGITDTMDQQISRVLAEEMSKGSGPREVARVINGRVDAIGKTRAKMLARTEIINAHAEATLNTFEQFGEEGVSVVAEWSAAADERVCPECEMMAGEVLDLGEARGMIPLHPNCRCSWIPIRPEKMTDKQKEKYGISAKDRLGGVRDKGKTEEEAAKARRDADRAVKVAEKAVKAAERATEKAAKLAPEPEPIMVPSFTANPKPAAIYEAEAGFDLAARSNHEVLFDLTEEEWKKATALELKDRVAKAGMFKQVPSSDVDNIIASKRFKSQFETGTSRGSLDAAYRKEVERAKMGVKETAAVESRPQYGYLSDAVHGAADYNQHGTHGYGGVTVKIKDSIRDRVTVCCDDSFAPRAAVCQNVDDPALGFFGPSQMFDEPLCCESFSNPIDAWRYGGYRELQFHNGISLDDIEKVYVPRSGPLGESENWNADAIAQKFRDAGVKVDIIEDTVDRRPIMALPTPEEEFAYNDVLKARLENLFDRKLSYRN